MLGLCKIHNEPEDIFVSQKIKGILNQNLCLSDYVFIRIIVHTVDGGGSKGVNHYFLEGEDVQNIGLPLQSPIELWDRDKKLQAMNDRILCIKVRNVVIGVCQQCFKPINELPDGI
jgi:hypothetical protein